MLSAHPMVKEVYYPRDTNGKSVKMGGFVTLELNISLLDIARFIDNLSLFQKGVFWAEVFLWSLLFWHPTGWKCLKAGDLIPV